jgi:hypothetical protein
MFNKKSLKIVALTLTCIMVSFIQATTRITVTNETFKTLVLYFDSMVYKRPQTEMILPKQTRSIYLEDYTDKDITKNITLEVRGGSAEPVTWSFSQTDLRDNMSLIFSKAEQKPLNLTVIKPNGHTKVLDPISLQ